MSHSKYNKQSKKRDLLMTELTKINIKYILLGIIGVVLDFSLFFSTYTWIVDLLPSGFIGLLLFLVYALFVFGVCIAYEFFLLYRYYKRLSKIQDKD